MKIKKIIAIMIILFLTGSQYVLADKSNEVVQNIISEKIEVSFPGAPSYLQNQKDADFKVSITNTESTAYEYTIWYSIDDWQNSLSTNLSVEAKKKASKQVSISNFPKGVYKLQVKICRGDLTLKTFSQQIAITEFYKHQFMDKYSRISVAMHYGLSMSDQGDIDMLNRGGFVVVRDAINWANIERARGMYDFTNTDTYVAMIDNGGIEPRMVVTFKNAFHTDGKSPYNNEPNPPRNLEDSEACAKFILNALKRYPSVKVVEMYNEPNLPTYWGPEPNAVDYANLIKIISTTVKKEIPDLQIVAGAVSPKTAVEFSSTMLNQGLLPYIDYYSFHPYIYPANPDTIYKSKLQMYADVIEPYGGWLGLVNSELGWTQVEGSAGVSPEQHALYATKSFIYNDQQGLASGNYYNFRDKGVKTTDREHMFGIISNDHKPKLTYIALAQQTKMLNNAEYVGVIPLNDSVNSFVYQKEGKPLLVAWAPNGKVSYSFAENNVTIDDMYGNPVSTTDFAFTEKPVYIQNISDDFIAKAVENEIKNSIAEIIKKYKDKANLESLDAILNDCSIPSLPNQEDSLKLLSKVYDTGDQIIKNGAGDMKKEEFMFLLYKIHLLAVKASCLYTQTATDAGSSSNQNINDANSSIKDMKTNSNSIFPYAEAMLKFATRFNKKANDVASLEANKAKNGIVASNHYHAARLSKWSEEIVAIEEANDYFNVYLYTSESKFSMFLGRNKNITTTLKNDSDNDIEADAYIVDEEEKVVSDVMRISAHAGKTCTVDLNLQLSNRANEGIHKYSILIKEDDKIIQKKDVTVTVSGAITASLVPSTTVMSAYKNVQIKLSSIYDQKIRGTVYLEVPEGWELSQNQKRFVLKPGENQIVSVKVNKFAQVPFNEYSFNVKVTNEQNEVLLEQKMPLNFLFAIETKDEINMDNFDGDISDWANAYPLYVNPPSDPSEKQSWEDANCSTKILTKWDANYYYCIADVYDDVLTNTYTDNNSWNGDSIQITFDTLNGKEIKYQPDDYEYCFANTPKGDEVFCHATSDPKKVGRRDDNWIKIIRDDDKNITRYFMKIPREGLQPLSLNTATKYGFNINMNDADLLDRDAYFEFSKNGTGGGKNPSLYQTFSFKAEEINSALTEPVTFETVIGK